MADLVWVKWYATIFRQNSFADAVAEVAPLALRYGATQYSVHVDNDDRYKVTQMTWVPDHASWYGYWEGPEMVEFRSRYSGHFQIPIVYAWADEIVAGSLSQGGNGNGGNGVANGSPASEPASSAV